MLSILEFENRLNKLTETIDGVSRAKEALDLELVVDHRLDPVLEELKDLKAVWTTLTAIWSQISDVGDSLWSTIQPRKLRQLLDGLLNSTREMPSRMRQYAAFEYVQDILRAYIKSNTIISDLKSEALRERHWRSLFKALKVSSGYSPPTMTLSSIWNLDLKKNEAVIKDVILQAQGEMALEEYLKQVSSSVLCGFGWRD
jgi:dynein heavy chain 1